MRKEEYKMTKPKDGVAPIVYADIQAYLDAIADKATNDIGNSPHKRFWQVPYDTFIHGTVPAVKSSGDPIPVGQPIPIIDQANPINSAFFTILTGKFAGKRQMPGGGPLITDAGYQVTVGGKTVKGQQIHDDIASWLKNGFPEK
jgi:hypothetical protein